MKCTKCGTRPKPTPVPLPPWMDPGPVMASTYMQYKVFTLAFGVATEIAKANPSRVAIGIYSPNSFGSGGQIFPGRDVVQSGWFLNNSIPLQWYYLFEHGPLVTSDWWAYQSAGGTIGCIQILKQLSG